MKPSGSPLLRGVHLKGRPRPEARAAHPAPSGRNASPALPHARIRAHREGPGLAEELHGSSVCPLPRSPPLVAKKDGVGGPSFPACPASLPTPPWPGDSLHMPCSTAPGGGTGAAPAAEQDAQRKEGQQEEGSRSPLHCEETEGQRGRRHVNRSLPYQVHGISFKAVKVAAKWKP
ncbi:translation initiation factor IF-2-like isoform X1 [Cricetulus griseus]|uniref:translation initiation factor IF-2-like isoform X1 n=1 Tax=Cricetulus griseus TaxID=10029 RepID=UPI0015C33109|nr:translation initiation factor IF-2-like isoform X1 [Cricetulus griseus]